MLNEIVKNANIDLLGRVKIAAAIVAIHNYDRTQDILQAAGEIQKNAAFQGIKLDDNQAIASAQNAYAEMDQAKTAAVLSDSVRKFLMKPGVRIGGGAALGAGLGVGGSALAGGDTTDSILAGLLGGGVGAFMGAKPHELDALRRKLLTKKQVWTMGEAGPGVVHSGKSPSMLMGRVR